MSDYVLTACSTADLSPEYFRKIRVPYICFHYELGGESHKDDLWETMDPHTFYQVLDGMWWNIDRHLDLEGTRTSAYATILECIRNGVTSIIDHHASYGEIEGSLFAIRDAAKELGIRAGLCYEVSERDGEKKCDAAI